MTERSALVLLGVGVAVVALVWIVFRRKRTMLARMLPRLSELKATMAEPEHPDSFFRDFEGSLKARPAKLKAFRKLEADLDILDSVAWADLRTRAARHLISKARDKGRGWEELFNILNEAKAYKHLVHNGCTGVRFIPQATSKTPDLEASCSGRRVLCEVKTFNISEEQAARRQRTVEGHIEAFSVPNRLDDAFLVGKLQNTLVRAVNQLTTEDPQALADRIVFCVLHADDWVGDYLPEYIAQIDAQLGAQPVSGAQLVFCVDDLFERDLSMKAGTIVNA